jgi:hypothetical protein
MKALWKFTLMSFAFVVAIGPLRDAAANSAAPIPDGTGQGPSSIGAIGTVWEPPNSDFSKALPKATIPKEMVSKIIVPGASVNLEETTISDIAAKFSAPIGHKGDGGDFVQWVCFRGADPGGDWVLWLKSGEINGGTIGSFRWQRIGAAVLDRRCRTLSGAVELQNQLRLGLAQADVLKDLGSATVWGADKAVYVHEHAETVHGEPYTSMNIVEVFFRRGEVEAIEVAKTTSS